MPQNLVGGVPLWLLKATALAVGAAFGSFANVLIWRIPRGESVVRPGSHCPSCNAPIRWYDNIPVLSWLVLGGRCRRCKGPISLRYPLIELCLAVLSLASLYLAMATAPQGAGLLGIAALWFFPFAFCLLLVAITFVDLEHWRIPPSLAIPGAVLGVLRALLAPDLFGVSLKSALLGLAVGAIGLAAVAEVWYLCTKREGMGYGDVMLLGMIGAFLGVGALPFVLLAASLQGLLVSVPLLLLGHRQRPPWEGPQESDPESKPVGGSVLRSPIPFGPFLALGAMEWLFFGDAVNALMEAAL